MATCVICDQRLESKRRHATYCGDACKQKAYRERLPSDRLKEVRAVNRERAAKWRLANPERAKELNQRWQERNREKTRANARRFAAANPGYGRVNTLRRQYGLTVEQYDALSDSQGGKCAACGQPEASVHQSGSVRRLAVDHDHATGLVRGLLCKDCNLGVGHFRDDPDRLDAAARYLRAHAP